MAVQLEQEIASIIRFMLDNSGNPSPYYYRIPQSFAVPAAYFPVPEIDTGAETLTSYNMDYTMFVKYFAKTSEGSYILGQMIAEYIRRKRNKIPLIDIDGSVVKGKYVRLRDPSIKLLDDGACQVQISWRSTRLYDAEVYEKMMTFEANYHMKYAEKVVTEAMEQALNRYSINI